MRAQSTGWPFAVLLVALCALPAAAAERGFPLITVYPAEIHKGGPQTFAVAQDPRGVLYFGNLHGLMTYDGAWWRMMALPNDQVALSVASDARGRIAVGMVNDFGYVDGDHLQSLLPRLPAGKRELGEVRAICNTSAGFLFVSERRLLTWDGTNLRTAAELDPDQGRRDCYAEGAHVYVYGNDGLRQFDPRTSALSPPLVAGNIDAVVGNGNALLVAVRDGGFFSIENNQPTPFSPAASEWMKKKTVTGACRLTDGRLVIATRQHGVAILDARGEIEQFITDSAGLPDAVISAAFLDREGSVWLAMEGPIVRLDAASPVTIFDARRGLKGGAADVARFQGQLYVATSHGLYRVDEHGAAQRIEGIRDAWRVLPVDDELIIGSGRGIYRGDANGNFETIIERDGEFYDLHRSHADPSRIWVAQRHGLGSIRRTNGKWMYEGLVSGVPEYIGSVIEVNGVVWTGSSFNGAIRVRDPKGPKPRVQTFGDGETNVFQLGDRVITVRTPGAIFTVDRNDKLVPDPQLGHIQSPPMFFAVVQDQRGDLWINSIPPRVFERQPDGTFAREGKPLVTVTAADIQTLRADSDGAVWFASDKGLFRYEPMAAPAAPSVRQPPPLILGKPALVLKHNFGRLRIEFAPVSYRPGVEYQYRLDPIDEEWSRWTEQPFIDYTTLSANDYTFRLRARGPSMLPSAERRWAFTVLPPWYRTRWAWALWILLALAAVVLFTRIRTTSLRRQAERLRARVAEKTAELQETVLLLEQANTRLEALSLEDDLTGIANRRNFERALADEWNRARRREQPLALILLDLDHFKDLNDRRGHPAGDDCLRRVGAFLAETVRRSGEVVARYGGEEFAILLPGVDADGAIRVAETLREGIERLGSVTASCGVAAIIPTTETSDQLVAGADRALYAAKHSGRNCVRVADESTTGTWLRDASA
jgi:diguanylate cyclase (GGDEF)-like protein